MRNVVRILSVLVFLTLRVHGQDAASGKAGSWRVVGATWPGIPTSSVTLSDGTGAEERGREFVFAVPPASYAPLRNEPGEELSTARVRQQVLYFAVEPQVLEGKTGKALIKFKITHLKEIAGFIRGPTSS
jgi:hypothetical protein